MKTFLIVALLAIAALAADEPGTPVVLMMAGDLPAGRVTAHLKDVAFRTALEQVLQSAHEPLPKANDDFWRSFGEKKVTLDLQNAPYWEAMRTLCDQVELSPESGEAELLMYPDEGQWATRPHIVDGPFILQAAGAKSLASAYMSGEPKLKFSQCTLELSLLAEPSAAPVRIHFVYVKKAIDEQGREIKLAPLPGPKEHPVVPASPFRNRWCGMSISLLPEPNARSIAKVNGEIGIVVAKAWKTVEMGNIQTAGVSEQDVGPLHFSIKAKFIESTCEIIAESTDTRKIPWRWEMASKNLLTTQPTLVDAKGRAFKLIGGSGSSLGDFGLRRLTRFRWQPAAGSQDRPQVPFAFSWKIPTETDVVHLPFEFTNLALPNRDIK